MFAHSTNSVVIFWQRYFQEQRSTRFRKLKSFQKAIYSLAKADVQHANALG